MKWKILTTVDITPTGIRTKTSDMDWKLKKKQQRNWDTIMQILTLRCQPLVLSCVVKHMDWNGTIQKVWELTFEVEEDSIAIGALFLNDIIDVPIISGLTETHDIGQSLSPFNDKNMVIIISE